MTYKEVVVFKLEEGEIPTNPLKLIDFLLEKVKEIPKEFLYDDNTTVDFDYEKSYGGMVGTLTMSYVQPSTAGD